MDEELPEQIPTAAAFTAVQHILSHGHDGLDPLQHFAGALMQELGLVDQELKAAEEAVVNAITGHPREQAAVDVAMAELDRLRVARVKRGPSSRDRGKA
jgi:hypothetical protein